MISELIEPLKQWAEHTIGSLGYPGVFLMMMLDSANIPIPSEVIMPFGGMLASEGKLNLHGVAIAGTLGSVVGSAISYWLGALFGKEFFLKYGKYVLLRPKEIYHAEHWFAKYGLKATLYFRVVPIARTFISLPAGIYKSHFGIFMLYSLVGSLPWAYLWAWIGFKLGQNWAEVSNYMHWLDYIVLAGLAFLLVRFLVYRFRKPKAVEVDAEVPAAEA